MRKILVNEVTLSNGETITYRVTEGGTRPVLLVHGNMNSSVNWDLLMERLPEDYKVYAPDLRGFGHSTYHHSIETIKDLSDDLKLFTNALGIHYFILSGWSLGGAVSMRFAIDHPKSVQKLILLASASVKGFPIRKRNFLGIPKKDHFIQTKEELVKIVKPLEKMKSNNKRWMLKKLLNASLYSNQKPDSKRYETYLDEMILQRNLFDVNYALMTFNISKRHNGIIAGTNEAHLINMPTLIIHGDKDKVVTLETAEVNQQAVGDNATLMVLKGCGHSPLLDDLDRLVKLYDDFMKAKFC